MSISLADLLNEEFAVGKEEIELLQEEFHILKELIDNVEYGPTELNALQSVILAKYEKITILEQALFANREMNEVLSMRKKVNDQSAVIH